jgi:hypothetical protein
MKIIRKVQTSDPTNKKQGGKSLLEYVKENTDKNGIYVPDTLPDGMFYSTEPKAPIELGSVDAYMILGEDQINDLTDDSQSKKVLDAITNYSFNPTDQSKKELYDLVSTIPCMVYCDYLLDHLAKTELPDLVAILAKEWFYSTPNREALKFSILMLGYFNLDLLSENYNLDLSADMWALAACEEFTYFVILAHQMSELDIDDELWALLEKTKGWGRVHCLENIVYDTPQKRDFLLRVGTAIEIDYPRISLLAINEGHLSEVIKNKNLDLNLYHAILNILNNYLEFLIEASPEELASTNVQFLPSYELIHLILEHAKSRATTIQELVGIVNLVDRLRELSNNNRWEAFTANDYNLLIAEGDALIYKENWEEKVKGSVLNADGSIDYLVVDFAYTLEIDIWDLLFNLLKVKPHESNLYNYLLATEIKERFNKALAFAISNLDLYLNDPTGLANLTRPLNSRPGQGTEILIKALISLDDTPRDVAVHVLEHWGPEHLSEEIRFALVVAKQRCQHTILVLRIDALLNKETFNISSILKLITELTQK